MNKHQVKLANGVVATRNSKTRIYTHATVMRVGEAYQGDDYKPGDEVVQAWHTTREAASRYLHTKAAEAQRVQYRASAHFRTVELLQDAPRKATCVNTPEPVNCLHKQGTPTKGSTMNKHRVILADGTEATRNSASREYTHATVVTTAKGEYVLSWHMTQAAAFKFANSSAAATSAAWDKGTIRIAEVELLPKKARKAPSAKKAVVEAPVEVQEVQEPVVEAPVVEAPVEVQEAPVEAAQEAPAAPAVKKQTTRMLKVECAEGSGYKVRLARTWLDSFGAPSCPCHSAVMIGA